MWEWHHKEGRVLKNWCSRTVMLGKTLENPLDSKIKQVNSKDNQAWIFIERTDAEAEAPILWPPNAKCQFMRKDPNARKNWGQKKKEGTEDKMVRWHHRLNGHEFQQTPRDSEGQASLACCSPRSCKASDTTERSNNSTSIFQCLEQYLQYSKS